MDMSIDRIPKKMDQTGFGDWKPDVREREESSLLFQRGLSRHVQKIWEEEMINQGEVSTGASTRICKQD
ncbi:hypothetical protein HispidOSU_024168 [Sigmodon hispidus]